MGFLGDEDFESFRLICPKCGSENTEIGTYRYDTIYCECLDCEYNDLPFARENEYEG